ncbi:MAG: methyl-accepting chemotaxis protein [Pseudomonadota bacterium]
MENKQRYKRKWRNYLINQEIQLKIVLTNLVYMVIVIMISLAVLLSPLMHDMFFSNDLDVQYQAAQTFLTLVKRLVPAVVIMFILIFVHQILITHRICGPLVNFTHTFKRIAEGDLTRKVILRKGDYLRDECEKINEMVDSLSRFIANVRTDSDKLVLLLEEVMGKVEDFDTKKKIAEALAIVKQEALLVKKDLSIFKIE